MLVEMTQDDLLTAAEAAARLGVKRQTLYAYVSRGLLDRTVDLDGRSSRFDPVQVDGLRQQHRRQAKGEVSSTISSSITKIDESGHSYRGESVLDLAAADTDFEHVADLLWDTEPVAADEWELGLDDTSHIRTAQSALSEGTRALDRLRVTVAVLSASDPLRNDLAPEAFASCGRRILAGMVAGLPKLHLGPRNRLADQLWLALVDQPGTAAQRQALNTALVLLADHGLASSTFAVRVAASVRADPYSIVSTGLGAFGGALHGVASSGVHRLLQRAEEVGPEATFGEELSAGRHLAGVGHAVYTYEDPRELALLEELRIGWADDPRLDLALDLRQLVMTRVPQPVNIDFALGMLTWLADIESTGTEIFAIARTAGWLAHAIEELNEEPLRFRPVARYVGPA
ncbi:MAG: citrate synthase [Acidimicrobiales bacterium]|jgi:citrate synthase